MSETIDGESRCINFINKMYFKKTSYLSSADKVHMKYLKDHVGIDISEDDYLRHKKNLIGEKPQ